MNNKIANTNNITAIIPIIWIQSVPSAASVDITVTKISASVVRPSSF